MFYIPRIADGISLSYGANLPLHTTYRQIVYAVYCVFFTLFSAGALYSQTATKASHPATVTQIPPIQTHAPLICQLLGHSS